MQDVQAGHQHIEELAGRLEVELDDLEASWSELAADDRATVIRRLASSAPGIARLLCPQYQRCSGLPTG